MKPCSGVFIIIVLLFLSLAPVSAYTSGDASIVVSISPKNVAAGNPANVLINITHDVADGTNLGVGAIGFDLEWDDSVANWTSGYAGTAFTTNFTDHLVGSGTDLITSWVTQKKFSYAWIGAAGVPIPQGQGTSVITFDHFMSRKSDGSTTTLHLSNLQVIDYWGNPIPLANIHSFDDTFTTASAPGAATQTTAEPTTQIPQPVLTEPGIPAITPPVPTAAPTRTPLDIMVVAGALVIGVALFARKKR